MQIVDNAKFVLNLRNDENADEICFQLPMCVGEHYRNLLPELATVTCHLFFMCIYNQCAQSFESHK